MDEDRLYSGHWQSQTADRTAAHGSRRAKLTRRSREGRRRFDLPPGLPEIVDRLAIEFLDEFLSRFYGLLEEAAKLTRDHLTQLPNRQAAEDQFKCSIPRTVGLADLDNFKAVNDTYGHHAGDDCLRAIARILYERCCCNGSVHRHGGEELGFATGLDLDHAVSLAEGIRSDVERLAIPVRNKPDGVVSVTISIGLAAVLPGDTFADAIDRADTALYSAKKQGRNKVVTYSPIEHESRNHRYKEEALPGLSRGSK